MVDQLIFIFLCSYNEKEKKEVFPPCNEKYWDLRNNFSVYHIVML